MGGARERGMPCQTPQANMKAKLSYSEQACWATPAMTYALDALILVVIFLWVLAQTRSGAKLWDKAMKALGQKGSEKEALLDAKPVGRPPRNFLLDNAKFWLQTLVVMKHIPVFWGHSSFFPQEAIGNYCESFFMQMYIFTSGYVAKGEINQRRASNTLVSLWVPLCLITALIRVRQGLLAWANGDLDKFNVWTMTSWNPTSGGDGLWFLTVIIVLKFLQPFLVQLKPHYLMATVWGLSWWSGYWWTEQDSARLAICQTMNMMPFYFTGYLTQDKHLKLLAHKGVRAAGLIITLAYLGWQLKTGKQNTTEMSAAPSEYWMRASSEGYYFSSGILKSGNISTFDYMMGWQQRMFGQFIAMTVGFSFMSLIPQEKGFFTEWGQRSLYAYILQFFVLYPPVQLMNKYFLGNEKGHFPSGPESAPLWALLYLLAPVMCAALSTKPCKFVGQLFLEPKWFGYLFLKNSKEYTPVFWTYNPLDDCRKAKKEVMDGAVSKGGAIKDAAKGVKDAPAPAVLEQVTTGGAKQS